MTSFGGRDHCTGRPPPVRAFPIGDGLAQLPLLRRLAPALLVSGQPGRPLVDLAGLSMHVFRFGLALHIVGPIYRTLRPALCIGWTLHAPVTE
eukprot:6180048-Pleurochrysis_carterae.AAC.3